MFMLKKPLLVALTIFISYASLLSQTPAIIQGKVIDKDTKDPLPAYISIKGADIGSSADYDGTFKLILESGDIQEPMTLEVFQLGYKRQEVEARIGEDILVEMELEPLPPHEVLVTADSMVAEETVHATVALKKMDVYTLPGTSADPIYTTQILPGVNSLPDSSSMLIRGGSSEEVAYYFDGIEIDNPFLTGSLHEAYFSIFNNQVISDHGCVRQSCSVRKADAQSSCSKLVLENSCEGVVDFVRRRCKGQNFVLFPFRIQIIINEKRIISGMFPFDIQFSSPGKSQSLVIDLSSLV